MELRKLAEVGDNFVAADFEITSDDRISKLEALYKLKNLNPTKLSRMENYDEQDENGKIIKYRVSGTLVVKDTVESLLVNAENNGWIV